MDKYNDLKEVLNSDESQRLDYKSLANYLEEHKLLNDEDFINYASGNDDIFKEIYEKHYVKNDKNFLNFTVFNSFCLSWLMYLYH